MHSGGSSFICLHRKLKIYKAGLFFIGSEKTISTSSMVVTGQLSCNPVTIWQVFLLNTFISMATHTVITHIDNTDFIRKITNISNQVSSCRVTCYHLVRIIALSAPRVPPGCLHCLRRPTLARFNARTVTGQKYHSSHTNIMAIGWHHTTRFVRCGSLTDFFQVMAAVYGSLHLYGMLRMEL